MGADLANPVEVGGVRIGRGEPLALIAGPCVLEAEAIVLRIAEQLARLSEELALPVVFKASYEKDNRSTVEGYRGPGLRDGLGLLARVRERTGLPILSDVHRESDLAAAAEVLDVIQIPAFLCQQTSLLCAAGAAARVVNLKKGQFLAPEGMAGPIGKVRHGGCRAILVTERGSCFGYNRLVADPTSVPILQALGCPVVFDATHIVRRYGISSGDPEGGRPEFHRVLSRCGVAVGADALFLETHPLPAEALCDAASLLPLDELRPLLEEVLPIAELVRGSPARRGTR
jgi:2-dehydro-3-deoxyphosphooctonate aldolase (KDO 8-P synthase)